MLLLSIFANFAVLACCGGCRLATREYVDFSLGEKIRSELEEDDPGSPGGAGKTNKYALRVHDHGDDYLKAAKLKNDLKSIAADSAFSTKGVDDHYARKPEHLQKGGKPDYIPYAKIKFGEGDDVDGGKYEIPTVNAVEDAQKTSFRVFGPMRYEAENSNGLIFDFDFENMFLQFGIYVKNNIIEEDYFFSGVLTFEQPTNDKRRALLPIVSKDEDKESSERKYYKVRVEKFSTSETRLHVSCYSDSSSNDHLPRGISFDLKYLIAFPIKQ